MGQDLSFLFYETIGDHESLRLTHHLCLENWKDMEKRRIDPQTGKYLVAQEQQQQSCSPEAAALRRRGVGSAGGLGAVVEGGREARDAGQGFVRRNAWLIVGGCLFLYVLATRLLNDQD